MRDLLRRGVESGAMAPDVDPKLTAMDVFGMMNWISTWWREDGPSSAEEVARQFTDRVLGGVVGPADGLRDRIGPSSD